MQGSGFPPLGHLPHWPRAGQAERPGRAGGPGPPDAPTPPSRRAAPELERSLQFLQQQHGETLRQLHQEVDRLKRRNQDLQYRLIMQPLLQQAGFLSADREGASARRAKAKRAGGGRRESEGRPEDAEQKAGEDEDEALAEEEAAPAGSPEWERGAEALTAETQEAAAATATSARWESPGGRSVSALGAEEGEMLGSPPAPIPRGRKVAPLPPRKNCLEISLIYIMSKCMEYYAEIEYRIRRDAAVYDQGTSPMSVLHPPASQSRAGDVKIPSASSNPFLVNVLPSYMRKPPSLEECEVVIRQLWNINHMQMQELMYLRSCLDDIHKTKRIPEDYMLAGQLGSQESTKLPRVRNAPKKCRILTPLPAAERAVLPALKQTLGNAFAERQKRAQAVQRNRLHRTAL
ncbi:coiled-coil domain-containing protein 74B-like [Pituophis catenifer annectens]|uniref:coiled-coil domain-containing protein 74B-like n=1 Tax=Pituophis catenifer annectens TaxID=94852 RepID=UPI0039910731